MSAVRYRVVPPPPSPWQTLADEGVFSGGARPSNRPAPERPTKKGKANTDRAGRSRGAK